MNESDKPTINEMQKIDVATPISSKHQKYPYNAIFIATIFIFIIGLVVLQQIQKTPEIASTAIAPTIYITKTITKSPTIIPSSISLTNTPPRPQYTPLPTPESHVNFIPNQAFIDSLAIINGPDEYPSSWPKDKELIPLEDQFRYVANMVNKDVGFSVVMTSFDVEAIFNCNEPVEGIVKCGQKPPSSFTMVYRITLTQDNPFSFDDPLRWLRLNDQQRSHVKVKLIKEDNNQNEYIIYQDRIFNDTAVRENLFSQPGYDLTSHEKLTIDVPWRYFFILGLTCYYSCPPAPHVFVRRNDPSNIYVVVYGQNGPFTYDITGRSFGYSDTFRILPKQSN